MVGGCLLDGRGYFGRRRERTIKIPAASSPRAAGMELPSISGTSVEASAESGTTDVPKRAASAMPYRHARLNVIILHLLNTHTDRRGETPAGRLAPGSASYFERRRARSTRTPLARSARPAEIEPGPISGTAAGT